MNGILRHGPAAFAAGLALLWAHLLAALLWGLYGYVTGIPLLP